MAKGSGGGAGAGGRGGGQGAGYREDRRRELSQNLKVDRAELEARLNSDYELKQHVRELRARQRSMTPGRKGELQAQIDTLQGRLTANAARIKELRARISANNTSLVKLGRSK